VTARREGDSVHSELEGDPSIKRFRQEIVSRGAFSHEWFLENIPTWAPVLRHLEGRKANLLEIGSFEGMSACFLLWRLPDAMITCVDTFAGSVEHRFMHGEVSWLESAFDANIALVDSTRVRKLIGDSRRILLELTSEETRFDLVYVDGSHLGLDVIVDASFAWQLLAPEGTIVFDDYRWAEIGEDPLLRPGPAVDAFLTVIGGKYELLFAGHQLGVRKVSGV
jgi:hypothetical protein